MFQVTSAPTSSWPKSLTTCMKIHNKRVEFQNYWTCFLNKLVSYTNKYVSPFASHFFLFDFFEAESVCFFGQCKCCFSFGFCLEGFRGRQNHLVWSFQISSSKCLNKGFAEGCWNKKNSKHVWRVWTNIYTSLSLSQPDMSRLRVFFSLLTPNGWKHRNTQHDPICGEF